MTEKKSKTPSLNLLPVIVLILVATFQLVMSNSDVLSPWKGGGFGMFSSLKNPGMRRVTVQVQLENGQNKSVSSKQFSKMNSYDQLRSFPKESQLIEFIEDLKGLKWKRRHGDSDDYVRINSTGKNASRIVIYVAELTYDNGTIKPKELLEYSWVRP
jgi:hypothetical protein